LQLGRAGQDSAAGDSLQSLALLASLTGETSAALSFVRQQKLHGEELPAMALLEMVRGDADASERAAAIRKFATEFAPLHRGATGFAPDDRCRDA
jgi:hypothetical protein